MPALALNEQIRVWLAFVGDTTRAIGQPVDQDGALVHEIRIAAYYAVLEIARAARGNGFDAESIVQADWVLRRSMPYRPSQCSVLGGELQIDLSQILSKDELQLYHAGCREVEKLQRRLETQATGPVVP